jgi:hypothetical protein
MKRCLRKVLDIESIYRGLLIPLINNINIEWIKIKDRHVTGRQVTDMKTNVACDGKIKNSFNKMS